MPTTAQVGFTLYNALISVESIVAYHSTCVLVFSVLSNLSTDNLQLKKKLFLRLLQESLVLKQINTTTL